MKYFDIGEENKIPQVGLGTFDLREEAILNGLEVGYRLLDTAWQYRNEQEVGRAIKKSGIDRENLFITTKLWTDFVRSGEIEKAVYESLHNLNMDYIDLYLIHWPAEGYERAWEQMIRMKEKGYIKHIGVSNFTRLQLEKISQSGVMPVINQVESHPYFCNDEIIDYCRERNIVSQAWCPIGGSYSNLKANTLFNDLAEKYGRTPVQIILRWHVQRNVSFIPRTKNKDRLIENLEIYDFEIMTEDMAKINSLNTGHRMGADPDNFNF